MSEEIIETTADTGTDVSDPITETGSLDSADDIAAALDKMDGIEGDDSEQGDETAEVDAAGGDEVSEKQEDVPAVPLPEGWEDGMWSGLSPEVQAHINARVQEHAKALAAEKQAQQELVNKQNAFTAQTNAQLQQALATMRQIVEAEYGGLNWQEIAQSDPASYVQLQQKFQQRMQAIQGIQQGINAQAEHLRQQREAKARQDLDNEYSRVLPEIRAMIGANFNGKLFASDMAQYLQAQGVPNAAINAISTGYELKLAAKAMLFDKMQQARSSAAQKVADAPKVSAPSTGTGSAGDGAARQKAMTALRNNPNSTEALAAVLGLSF